MNVKINVVIFTTDNKERKDVRKLREKKLQIVLDENNNLPTFDINNKEEAKITACNKIIEMFGISKFYIEQLYTWADPQYYDETHEILITYLVIINKNNIQKNVENLSFYDITIEDEDANFQKVILESEKKKIEYKIETYTIRERDSIEYMNRLSGDSEISELNAIIIHTGLKRLRNRIDNTNIAFSFLEDEFTISELQQVYEIILDKKLVSANFRKKIEPMIKKTDQIVKESAYRPSARYKFNEDYLKNWV